MSLSSVYYQQIFTVDRSTAAPLRVSWTLQDCIHINSISVPSVKPGILRVAWAYVCTHVRKSTGLRTPTGQGALALCVFEGPQRRLVNHKSAMIYQSLVPYIYSVLRYQLLHRRSHSLCAAPPQVASRRKRMKVIWDNIWGWSIPGRLHTRIEDSQKQIWHSFAIAGSFMATKQEVQCFLLGDRYFN